MSAVHRRVFLKQFAGGAIAAGGLLLTGSTALAVPSQQQKVDWFETINRVKDPNNKTHTERVHAPQIIFPSQVKPGVATILSAKVGEQLHVMTPDHYIMWIEVYLDEELVVRLELTPRAPQPVLTIPLTLTSNATLKILERCNLHGIWESSQSITLLAGE